MIPEDERVLLHEQMGKELTSLLLCSVKAWGDQVEYNEQKTYFGLNY